MSDGWARKCLLGKTKDVFQLDTPAGEHICGLQVLKCEAKHQTTLFQKKLHVYESESPWTSGSIRSDLIHLHHRFIFIHFHRSTLILLTLLKQSPKLTSYAMPTLVAQRHAEYRAHNANALTPDTRNYADLLQPVAWKNELIGGFIPCRRIGPTIPIESNVYRVCLVVSFTPQLWGANHLENF
jgi:hypothetical protein